MLEALQAGKMCQIMKNPHAVALGRLGGLKGGRVGGNARAKSLSAGRRTEIARAAAVTRWARVPEFLRVLFPGYSLDDLKLPEHSDLVMLHVLTRGGADHKKWLIGRFGDQGIRRWIHGNRGKGLTVKQMTPWVSVRTARAWQATDPYALLWENR
jgi:hypothetical protein